MYLRTDTHWTPQGARVAARTLAAEIGPVLDARGSPRAAYGTAPGGTREVAGDLLTFVPLGPWQARGPGPDRVEEPVTELREQPSVEEGAAGLFSDLRIPVALVGTSYSASPISRFESALRDALNADVLNVAEEGKGPFAPMDAYLASPVIDDPRPDVVVWEIPERYLVPDRPAE
jgi:alginate O-acetyltransferase complex protein AlgJ